MTGALDGWKWGVGGHTNRSHHDVTTRRVETIKQLHEVVNSSAVSLDKPMLGLLGLEEGGQVLLTIQDGLLIVAPANPRRLTPEDLQDHLGLPSMAAACHYHLCANHPFLDGNKRVAVAVAEDFLRANGLRLEATDDEIVEPTLGVASGATGRPDVTAFYTKRVHDRRCGSRRRNR